MTQDEIVALIVSKAHENNLVDWEFLGGAIAESALNPSAWRQGTWPDWSAGLFQQTVLYADEGDHTASAENVALIQHLYFDPVHACDVAAKKYAYWRHDPEVGAVQAWCGYNGGQAGYRSWQTWPNRANYEAGLAQARQILGVPMPDPVYDQTAPVDQQANDWSCAVVSTRWALTAFGRHPSESWLEAQMIADGVESTAVGLLDGSGAALAAWITRQYGPSNNDPTLQYHAYNVPNVTFSDVVQVAGLTPVLIGGHNWGGAGHWSGVRRYDQANDWLALANPANNYGGIGQTMTRAQWETIAPVSMVVLQWGTAPQPVPTPTPVPVWTVPDGVFAGLTGPQLQARAEGLAVTVADIADRLGDQIKGYAAAITATVDQMGAERVQAAGPR